MAPNRNRGDDAFAPVAVRASKRNAWTPAAGDDAFWGVDHRDRDHPSAARSSTRGGGEEEDYSDRRGQQSSAAFPGREDLLDPSRSFTPAGAGGGGGYDGYGGRHEDTHAQRTGGGGGGQGRLDVSDPPGNTEHDPLHHMRQGGAVHVENPVGDPELESGYKQFQAGGESNTAVTAAADADGATADASAAA